MKIKYFFLGMLLMLCNVQGLQAQSNDICCSTWEPCATPEWFGNFYLAPEIYYERDRISTNPHAITDFVGLPQSKSLHGTFYGVNTGYIYRNTWGLYVQVDGDYAVGKLKNRTSTSRQDHDLDIEGLLGYYLSVCDFSLTPYFGLGYSFHRQKFEEKTFANDNLELRYQIYYIPVGIRLSYLFTPTCEIEINFKAMPQMDSTMKASTFKGMRWELAKTTGYFLEIPLTWNIYHRDYVWKFVLIPFWRRTIYGEAQKNNKTFVLLSSPRQTFDDWGGRLEAGTCF